jgi:hypothetical protein
MTSCSSTLWSCNYDACSQGNFTVTNGTIVLRDYQATSLGVYVPATTVTVTFAGPTNASQTLGPSTGTIPTSSQSGSAISTSSPPSNSEAIKVGVGVGATMGIALIALMILFYRERKRNARLEQTQNSRSGIAYSSINNPMLGNGTLEQDGRRTTLAELRGDGTGYELSGGNLLPEMGGTNER